MSLSNTEKNVPNNTAPIKPAESSTMTREEGEEIHNYLSKLENQFNEMGDSLLKNVYFPYLEDLIEGEMDQNIDENMEQL